jgi:hypothetical protein
MSALRMLAVLGENGSRVADCDNEEEPKPSVAASRRALDAARLAWISLRPRIRSDSRASSVAAVVAGEPARGESDDEPSGGDGLIARGDSHDGRGDVADGLCTAAVTVELGVPGAKSPACKAPSPPAPRSPTEGKPKIDLGDGEAVAVAAAIRRSRDDRGVATCVDCETGFEGASPAEAASVAIGDFVFCIAAIASTAEATAARKEDAPPESARPPGGGTSDAGGGDDKKSRTFVIGDASASERGEIESNIARRARDVNESPIVARYMAISKKKSVVVRIRHRRRAGDSPAAADR